MLENKGFDPATIEEFKNRMKNSGQNFLVVESEDNSDEYINFNFIGIYEGKEVIYDAAIYTLRLHHLSEIYEIAEHKAAQNFPEFKKIKYEEDENGDLEALDDLEEEIGLFIAETIMELEEEGEVKVKEHIEIDESVEFGVGIDIGLNKESIDKETITKFVTDYVEDHIQLDDTLYTFHTQDEELTD